MRKNNIRIKSNITLEDKIKAINGIVSSYFSDGEYTPYYAEVGEIVSIVTFFIEGLEFDGEESIYESVTKDSEVMELIEMFYTPVLEAGKIMSFVKEHVNDKVDFIKQQIIHSHDDMNKIIEFCNVVIDSFGNFSKLNFSQMNTEDLQMGMQFIKQLADKDFTVDDLSDVIKNVVDFDLDKASAEIIDAKNAEIRELKKYKALWEGRNVQSDNKVVPLK